MDNDSIKKIEELFKHHIGILSEDFQHKLDLVVEGQQMVAEKVDRLETRMERLEIKVDALEVKVDALEVKVDAVAADLSAHRADTEAHHGVYRVKEGREGLGELVNKISVP